SQAATQREDERKVQNWRGEPPIGRDSSAERPRTTLNSRPSLDRGWLAFVRGGSRFGPIELELQVSADRARRLDKCACRRRAVPIAMPCHTDDSRRHVWTERQCPCGAVGRVDSQPGKQRGAHARTDEALDRAVVIGTKDHAWLDAVPAHASLQLLAADAHARTDQRYIGELV